MPSSPAFTKDLPPSLASRWSTSAAAPWSRLLALQILQVTSLSITFSLAYDFSTLALSPSLLAGSARQSSTSRADVAAAQTSVNVGGPAGGAKGAGRGRKKKGSKSGPSQAAHQRQQHLQHANSDTEFEDADDLLDGDAQETAFGASSGVASSQGHVHYPLYQRGSELLGSSPVDLGESSTGGGGNGRPHFATLLSKGLSVTVNGSPWRSVAAHVIEGEDEAVVVIYGLSPGRDYLVELGLVGDEEGRFADLSIGTSTSAASGRTDSVTALPALPKSSAVASSGTSAHTSAMSTSMGNSAIRSRSRANSLRTRSRANSAASNANPVCVTAQPASSGAGCPTPAASPAPASPHPLSLPPSAAPTSASTASAGLKTSSGPESIFAILEDQLAQSQAYHAHLASELKSHRRTSQKSEATLRANITALQKAAEKNSVGDLRARQKALALGESVKRLVGGKEDVDLERERLESQVSGIEGEDGGLDELEKTRHAEWDAMRLEAENVEKERDEVVGANERQVTEWEAELGALLNKLDKLNTKHDRITSQISTYNDRLESIAKEKAEISSGTHPALRDAALSYNAHSHRGGVDFGSQQSRGRPPPLARGAGQAGNARGGQWKSGPPSRGPPHAYPSSDTASQQHVQGSSTSPLQISAAPFRPQHNHSGPHQYHRSSPSFTVQTPHTQSSGVNSHAQSAQNSFLAANAQADPYSAVFVDRDEPSPDEPAAFPPLPSTAAAAGMQATSQGSPSPSLAHQQVTPGSYSLAAVSTKPTFGPSHHLPSARPNIASFSSASPQSSPAFASAQLARQQQQASTSDAFPPLSPVGSVGTPSRQGSLVNTPKGTPDPAERAAHIPLPQSPAFEHK